MAATFLTNNFLIAMPSMEDPNFAQTVTLVCEHSDRGADRQMERLVEDCRKRAAKRGAKLQCFGVAADMTFKL